LNPPYHQYLDSTLDALHQLRETGDTLPYATRQMLQRFQFSKPVPDPAAKSGPVCFLRSVEKADPSPDAALQVLLGHIQKAMKLEPANVLILESEPEAGWEPWLETNRPGVIICLGGEALGHAGFSGAKPGEWLDLHGTPVIATIALMEIHSTGELAVKRQLWEHMLQVLQKLDQPITPAQRNYFKK